MNFKRTDERERDEDRKCRKCQNHTLCRPSTGICMDCENKTANSQVHPIFQGILNSVGVSK